MWHDIQKLGFANKKIDPSNLSFVINPHEQGYKSW